MKAILGYPSEGYDLRSTTQDRMVYVCKYIPKGPSTNIIRTLGFFLGNCCKGLGQVLLICRLGPSGYE